MPACRSIFRHAGMRPLKINYIQMRKRYYIPIIIMVILVWLTMSFIPNKIVSMVTNFEPYTFERVLEDSLMRVSYGILNQEDPGDYGYTEVEEVVFYSGLDSLQLNGWWINGADCSDACILLLHGRTSNRLKTMKYLALFKEYGLDKEYNFFVPDLRNSGKSSPSPTYMGYSFAEDIAGAIQFLKNQHNQNNFVFYAFSMGAMATEVLLDRADLAGYMENSMINGIILDSPLANIEANLKISSDQMSIPDFIFERSTHQLDQQMNGYFDKMKFSYLMKRNNIPTLILAGDADTTTPISILNTELGLVDRENIEYSIFPGASHVRIYQSDKYRSEYSQAVVDFLTTLP